ncbi:MAG: MBL fold metallo-hydrolase [Rhodocyclaceae bacterium]|nr:MBL fold metallo-hydrolase [Rhodocyclaceae bacterium]
MNPHLSDFGHDIYAIDSGFGRPQLDAVHVIVHDGRAALVDTAVNAGVPRVLAALAALGIARAAVDYVVLTHVHLDHAGGAGLLMRELPNAKLTVHPRGARHMIDPAMLTTATHAVYGEAKARAMYGDILPVPKERIIETPDGATLNLAGRELLFLDTPGHARHHVCIRDGLTGHFFTGDTFGFIFRELDVAGRRHAFPTLTPTQFDPEQLHRSIDRILSYGPQAVYATHYGQATDTARLAADLHRLIDAQVELARREKDAGERRKARIRDGIAGIVEAEASRQHWPLQGQAALDFFGPDIELNAQGLEVWLDSLQRPHL